jgi:hypothetical protein
VGRAQLDELNAIDFDSMDAHTASNAFMSALDTALSNTCPVKTRPLPAPTATHRNYQRTAEMRISRAGLNNRPLPPHVLSALNELKHATAPNLADRQRVAAKALREHKRLVRGLEAAALDQLRVSSSHRFFTTLTKQLAPEDTNTFVGGREPPIPDEMGHPPALLRFTAAYAALYSPKPPPPGLGDENWLKFVAPNPIPADDRMCRPFTALEILPLLFPVSNYDGYCCPATGTSEAHCKVCNSLKRQAEHWGGPNDIYNTPPSHKPRGKAQSALNGPHLLAFLSWADHPSLPRRTFRLRICAHIARVLSLILAEERMPPGTTNYKAIPLRKPAAPGTFPNWADPKDSYRFLNMSPLLTKILCLAIDARTIHMVVKNNLINLNVQGASIPFMGTEWHVFALLESIKAEWQQNRDVYTLFIDWKKAYDNVHPDILASQLQRMGFPAPLIRLLAHWNSTRTSTLYINGVASAPIPTQSGIGQGDVFSCVLYVIFINSYNNYIADECQGITPYPNTTITSTTFVDDSQAPCTSIADAKIAATSTYNWGVANGHTMQTAPHKTAVLRFPAPGADNPAPPAVSDITLPDGQVVPYTDTYKYLGLVMRHDLDESAHLKAFITSVKSNHARFMAYNSITRNLSQTAICQILKTACLSGYLLSIINNTVGNRSLLDAALHRLQRSVITGLSSNPPAILLEIESNIPSAQFILTRSALALYLALDTSVYREAPAVKLLEAQKAELAAGNPLPATSFLRRLHKHLDKYIGDLGDYTDIDSLLQFDTYSPGKRPGPSDASRAASVYARMVWVHDARHKLLSSGSYTHDVVNFSQAPAPGPPTQHVYDLHFGFFYALAGAQHPSRSTPISCSINMGSGNLIARTTTAINKPILAGLYMARQGAVALSYPPLAPARWLNPNRSPEQHSVCRRGLPCPFCADAIADPRHIICDCTHPAVVAARVSLRASAASYISVLAGHIRRANAEPHPAAEDACNRLESAAPPDWDTPSGKSLLHRLVLVLPWPETCVDDAAAGHCLLLGRAMDHTVARNSSLHKISNSWVAWGGKSLSAICSVWATAVDTA